VVTRDRWGAEIGPEDRPEQAPDGSTVRRLIRTPAASVVECTLPAAATSRATRNLGIDEIWLVTAGQGELWREAGNTRDPVPLNAGDWVAIPDGIAFQFRSIGDSPLTFICVTVPPWPGAHANQPASRQRWEPAGIPGPERRAEDG
jgi:mannose-6-phosphate isomerase-like protein (cupin superfamily)